MGLMCRLFGHKVPPGYGGMKGEGYFDVHVGPIDGIGRVHARLSARCARCNEGFAVGNIHVPYVSELCARRGLAKSEPVAYAIRNGDGFWSGIWKERETAAIVLAKGLKSNKETIVPLYADMQTSDHDIRIGRYVRKLARDGGTVGHKMMKRLIESAMSDQGTAGIGRMADK